MRQPAPSVQPPDPAAIARAAQWVRAARHVAVLTGAGVSAESGIATFRDPQTGYWAKYNPQQIASPAGFRRDPGRVWRWYMERLAAVQAASPNPGHLALAQLAAQVPRLDLITQNVDDLHERAGSEAVIHLHGSITAFRCHRCAAPYALQDQERRAEMPPTCPRCGGRIRPAVVWFGELLPADALARAEAAAAACDLFLIVGTGGMVAPASLLPWTAQAAGATIIDVNPDETPYTDQADVVLRGPSGVMLPALLRALQTD